ncbi:hypothetical protein [Natrialba sp. PRR66]|uniref:hypothetical protein n=1 Tax=Natrialba sp. PRR66 TaxID=3098146 RepID=UPI002B1E80EC|nr:hypothetical protein [Natrialba sp. PRR66]
MNRRSVVALAATVPFAGCTGLLAGGGVDTTIGEDEIVEFSADAGSELAITVEVEEIFPLGDGENGSSDLEREGIGFRLDHEENGIVDTRTITADEETFEVSIEDGGTHVVMLIGGVGHVTIE